MLQTLGWYTFDKYYSPTLVLTDKVTAYAATLLLAPHWRKAYMARNWKMEWRPRAIETWGTLWRKQYKDKAPIVHLSAESRSLKEPDKFALWERDQSIISQIGDELDFWELVYRPTRLQIPPFKVKN